MDTTEAPAVHVRGLRCTYGEHEAVRGVDLDAPRGELLAVLGTNGAGKTTTLEAMQGRRRPAGGRVRILGLDPVRQRRALAARIGVMLQDSALPAELTPAEFLALWSRLKRDRPTPGSMREQLTAVGLAHRRNVRIGRLSGGERRRLDLAVALTGAPELLFLDEPTSGLDPESRAATWELIRGLLRTGSTIVLTTHHLEEAEALADRLLILHEGTVAVAGTLSEIVTARRATIRYELVGAGPAVPESELVGRASVTPERGVRLVEIRTPDLTRDLGTLLRWAETQRSQLHRLHSSEATLAEIFHEISTTHVSEEATTS
ncbi:ABC transporter ATP-binding protein [Prauserella halophila]|nr:ABC transporter ATP-binding protein [Prauserella halophila]MCP2237067.1 ABC-2 type transport system ATP-binding protein [Prauserella halophila]